MFAGHRAVSRVTMVCFRLAITVVCRNPIVAQIGLLCLCVIVQVVSDVVLSQCLVDWLSLMVGRHQAARSRKETISCCSGMRMRYHQKTNPEEG
eukprot:2800843-Amphidinium_carterae.1